ncbi:uncharacterized protein LOC133293508 [Gastrolobium bilobum]|uniref:uncharacterized protein LOC133293508 n=1 Tax=Gastrolobium bilobum TaxID=150636 RepID=UPI002AB15F3A|nr:uncharacterized protein LOC133293508 [Gastrolobium bilobum]
MGKKKAKDPQQTPQSDSVSSPSGIFNTLFGNGPEQTTATASLFSDFNPFRRKPQQHASVSYPTIPSQSPNNGGSGSHDSGEDKKRKRKKNKEKRPILDSDSVTEASEKKRKRGSDERGGEGKDLNLGTQTKKGEVVIEGEEGKMKKKKRKREELEKEWEEKKYGVVVEGEEDEKERFGNKTVGSKRKMIDNPADMLVSKEGFDDEDKLLRTIFVGNLPLKLKKKTLLKEFKQFGEVESVRIRSVPIQDVGFLFVECLLSFGTL